MLKFSYTCPRHQRKFVAAVKRAGCSNAAKMEEVRQRLQGWFAQHYPQLMLDHFREGTCLGCDIEALGGDLGQIDRAVLELATTRAAEQRRERRERTRAAGHPWRGIC